MRRDLSTLDRDIGQPWSRIIQEAFKHGIDCDIIYGGLLEGKSEQGIHEVNTVQNYIIGSRRVKVDGRVFVYAKAGATLITDLGCKSYDTQHVAFTTIAKAAKALDTTVTIDVAAADGDAGIGLITKDELVGGYLIIFPKGMNNSINRRIEANNAVLSAGKSDATIVATTDVDIANDKLTVTIDIPTGAEIKFTTDNTLPTPLVVGTTYYAIRVDATHIKVATSLANANAGIAIDLTDVGTGTHTVTGVGEMTLTLDKPLPVALVADDDHGECMASPYLDVRTGGGSTSSIVGVPTMVAKDGEFLWIQTWGPVWIAPQGEVSVGNNNRQVVFRHDGSIDEYDATDPYTVKAQHAGFVLQNAREGGQGAAFIMLQISP